MGVHLFSIHLETLKQAREKKESFQLKSLEFCGKTTVYERQRKFENRLKRQAQIEGTKIYGKDQVILKQISYSINHMDFQINYKLQDDKKKEKKLTSIV